MKEDIWIKQQLKEIETLQKTIIVQQWKAEDNLTKLKRESVLIFEKITQISNIAGNMISPELERQINLVSARAVIIDNKVSDKGCSE